MSLHIDSLTKTYPKGVKAMDNISLQIDTGMFGLLGPNGAGKSSLMRTLATLQLPDSGTIHFNGLNVLKNPMELRKQLGYLPQEFGVYPKLSARKLLDYFALLKGISSKIHRNKCIEGVLELTNLKEVQNKSVSEFSGGMKQRFGIAQLLLNQPKLIIVDEPTAGLDPEERRRFLNVLRAIGSEHIVLFSTHIVEDVTDLCTDLAIMNQGCVLKKSTPKMAIKSLRNFIWTKTIKPDVLSIYQSRYDLISSHYSEKNQMVIKIFSKTEPDTTFKKTEPSLEDVYFITLNHNA